MSVPNLTMDKLRANTPVALKSVTPAVLDQVLLILAVSILFLVSCSFFPIDIKDMWTFPQTICGGQGTVGIGRKEGTHMGEKGMQKDWSGGGS